MGGVTGDLRCSGFPFLSLSHPYTTKKAGYNPAFSFLLELVREKLGLMIFLDLYVILDLRDPFDRVRN